MCVYIRVWVCVFIECTCAYEWMSLHKSVRVRGCVSVGCTCMQCGVHRVSCMGVRACVCVRVCACVRFSVCVC